MTTAPLTVKEAAERLGVSPSLVYALVAAHRLRHERHGLGRGTIRITGDALDEYRAAAAVKPPPPAPAGLTHITLR